MKVEKQKYYLHALCADNRLSVHISPAAIENVYIDIRVRFKYDTGSGVMQWGEKRYIMHIGASNLSSVIDVSDLYKRYDITYINVLFDNVYDSNNSGIYEYDNKEDIY